MSISCANCDDEVDVHLLFALLLSYHWLLHSPVILVWYYHFSLIVFREGCFMVRFGRIQWHQHHNKGVNPLGDLCNMLCIEFRVRRQEVHVGKQWYESHLPNHSGHFHCISISTTICTYLHHTHLALVGQQSITTNHDLTHPMPGVTITPCAHCFTLWGWRFCAVCMWDKKGRKCTKSEAARGEPWKAVEI